MMVSGTDRQWSVDFINVVVNAPHGLERIEDFLSNKMIFHCLYDGDPYRIYTYQNMLDIDPDQNICKEDEVVLSKNFVGYEEELQVLTYDKLREIVCVVKQSKDTDVN